MKNDLRVLYKKIRKSIHSKKLDNLIYENIINMDIFKVCNSVLIYWSINDEVDTINIIKYCLNNNKSVYIPKCNNGMDFYLINSFDDLKIGKYNILESKLNDNNYNNSICITPGICFDKSFYRLGYGKGYYDRFFKSYNGIKIGLCYDDCLIDDCNHDDFDECVDIIVTDKKIIKRRTI